MLISKFSEPVTDNQLIAFSDKLGVELPVQLQLFLKKYNGGETPETSFVCGDISSDITAFYGLGDVKYSYKNIELLDVTGAQYLPIAVDSFGNEILIGVHSGAINFYDHEVASITELSKDLKTFIGLCKSEELNPASRKSIQEREQDLIRKGRGHIISDGLRAMWQAEIDKYANMVQEEVEF